MNISNYLEQAWLNATFRGVPYTSPEAVFVALYTSDPTDADEGAEVSGGAYVRQEVAFTEPIDVDGRSQIQNEADVVFPIATADWGAVSHIAICDAETGGNLLYHGPLTNPRTIFTSDRLRLLAGEIKIDLD